jgi:hypothetical protein
MMKPNRRPTFAEISDWVDKCCKNTEDNRWCERVSHHDAIAIAGAALYDLNSDARLMHHADGVVTDEDLETSFRVWWKERYGTPYFGSVPLVSVIEWTRYFNNQLDCQPSVHLDKDQVIGILHVSNFRGYENAQFDYIAELPDGRYELFIRPTHPDEDPTDEDIDNLERKHWIETGVQEQGQREYLFNHRSFARAILSLWSHRPDSQAKEQVEENKLVRYSFTWNGSPNQPLFTPKKDGYWTPWHIADALMEQLSAPPSKDEIKEAVELLSREVERLESFGMSCMEPMDLAHVIELLKKYSKESRRALDSIATLNQECDDYGDDYGPTTRDDGEVVKLVEWMEDHARHLQRMEEIGAMPCCSELPDILIQAAELIKNCHSAPVVVDDNPWEREGWCDKDGRCWCFIDIYKEWKFRKPEPGNYDTHYLPFNATSLPTEIK